jgi:uncharacterized membrane protein
MDFILRYSALFFFGGIVGWIIELFFRRFVSQKKWVNPGFLTGPCLPLYGFGTVIFYFLSSFDYSTLTPFPFIGYALEIIFIGAALTVVEYVAGLIFIKGMKVKLWDYSDQWGNIQGIICPLFTLVWTLFGAFYVFVLKAPMIAFTDWVVSNSLTSSLLIGFAYGILSVDLGWSIGLVKKIRAAVNDAKLVVDWDKIKVSFQQSQHKMKQRVSWLFAFHPRKSDFTSLMNEYLDSLRYEMSQRKKIIEDKLANKTNKKGKK